MAITMNKGTTDQILFGTVSAFSAPAAVTWMYWFYRENINMTNDGYVFTNDGSQLHFPHITANNINAGVAGVWFAGTGATTVIAATTWTHIAAVYTNGPTLQFYVNGVAVTTGAAGVLSATATALKIQDSVASSCTWEHLKVFNVALTADQVWAECWSYTPVIWDSSLVMWNPLNDGLNCADYSGNGVNGTITGGSVSAVGVAPVSPAARPVLYTPRTGGYRGKINQRNQFRRGRPGTVLIPYYQGGA